VPTPAVGGKSRQPCPGPGRGMVFLFPIRRFPCFLFSGADDRRLCHRSGRCEPTGLGPTAGRTVSFFVCIYG